MKRYMLCAVLVMLLGGCLGSDDGSIGAHAPDAPDALLSTLAKALNNKDATLFLSQFDVSSYASAATNRLMQDVAPLGMLDSMGKSLGLGSIEGLVGLVTGSEDEVKAYFQRQVSTGELVQQCSRVRTPDCPWVPQSLTDAVIKELSPTAAVAGVTTPTNIRSWLALAKVGDVWKVVGAAALEQDAARYARAAHKSPATSSASEGANGAANGGAGDGTGASPAPHNDAPAPPPPARGGSNPPPPSQQDEPAPPPPVRL